MDPFSSALDVAAAIRSKDVSPVEVADFYLERIEALEPALNTFAHRADDDVRDAAKRAEQHVMSTPADELEPFVGVPVPIKNLNPVAGWPCTYGSRGANRAPRPVSDPIVDRFVDAGFVLLGVTNSPEFGTISYTESDAHGITRNPWNPQHTPGGSSGGSAAAVAAGMAPLGHANDGGGSIRIPASCTGLVGLKGGRGRVPNEFIEIEGFVCEGVVTRTVADTAAVYDVLDVVDPLVFFSAPRHSRSYAELAAMDPPRLRVAYTADAPLGLPVDPECVAAVIRTVRALEAAGHTVVETSLEIPEMNDFVARFIMIWNTGSVWSPMDDWDAIEPLNAALRAEARRVNSLEFASAVRETQRMARAIIEPFGRDFDVLVTPTMAVQPPEVGSWRGADGDPTAGLLNCYPMAVFTSIFNVTGLPAISLPVHQAESGLPVGVQLVAPPWREDLLLQLGSQLEASLPWRERHPALSV
ncbi:MAG TPA: amidase [Acidimicrobiales bacterium]|nr:amidase [Acidimicrobiales bacterium]